MRATNSPRARRQAFPVGFSAQVLSKDQPQNFTIHSGHGIGDLDVPASGGMMFGSYYQAPEASRTATR